MLPLQDERDTTHMRSHEVSTSQYTSTRANPNAVACSKLSVLMG